MVALSQVPNFTKDIGTLICGMDNTTALKDCNVQCRMNLNKTKTSTEQKTIKINSLESNSLVNAKEIEMVAQAIPKLECPGQDKQASNIKRSNSHQKFRKANENKSYKRVSFASSIEEICHFIKSESPNNVSLHSDILYVKDNGDTGLKSISSSLLIPEFWRITYTAPLKRPNNTFNVVLDQMCLVKNVLRISILTKNIQYEKRVYVRMTFDHWNTYQDSPAEFQAVLTANRNGYLGLDRFLCLVDLSNLAGEKLKVDFCIKYETAGTVYWDNNQSMNYSIELERQSEAHSSRSKFSIFNNKV
jgi:hypothetical protein